MVPAPVRNCALGRDDVQIELAQPVIHHLETTPAYSPRRTLGDFRLIISTAAAQRRALTILVLTLLLGATRFSVETFVPKAHAAGAFAVGKCGAYGQAYDYPAEGAARAAALKQCKGECTTVTMKRAGAARALDKKKTVGPPG